MNILVTNIGRKIYFVEFLINLKNKFKNLNIHLADNDDYSSAKKYGKTKNHKIPLVSDGSKRYLNAIRKIVLKNRINLIIPVTNHDLKILALNKEKLQKYNCKVLVSSHKLIKKLLNKELLYHFCKENKINVPNTYFNIKKLRAKRNNLFIKKDKFGSASSGMSIIKKIKKNHFYNNCIVQDFIHGEELHFDILNDFKGNYLASCVKKKIQMRSGETDKAEVLYNKKFENLAKRISRAFEHVGNLDCDAIINKRGTVFFLDFNPRFGGGYPFTHAAGLNFLKLIICILLKKKFNLPPRPKLIKASKGLVLRVCK